ncbi:MAG: hypothetical protein UHD09_02895 [Bifidobacterium sp.]|nr:hypothetical protein [Bifidobacterium sp.]
MNEEELLAMMSLTTEQADHNAAIAKSENIDDELVGAVYPRLHMLSQSDEPMPH